MPVVSPRYCWTTAAAVALSAVISLPLSAQVPQPVPPQPFRVAAGANVVTVVAHEYSYTMPDTIPAGLTTFRLDDAGKQLHHFNLVRLDAGKTLKDFADAMKAAGTPPPAWMHVVGGPNTPEPGRWSNATLQLTPGYYVAFCVIPDPAGAPHLADGMMHSFVVTPSTHAAAPLPQADVTITLTDYDFIFSRPLTAGHHVIAVTNTSGQPHEIVLTRYQPGKGNQDFEAWAHQPGDQPSPAYSMGGVTSIPPGATVIFEETFTPGRYGAICFLPDAKDGKPHFMHGMATEFVVK